METKHKRTNLGKKEEPITENKREKNRMIYPSFYVRKKLPTISKVDIGKTFNVSAKIKLTGMRQDAMDVNKINYNYDFDVIEIGF